MKLFVRPLTATIAVSLFLSCATRGPAPGDGSVPSRPAMQKRAPGQGAQSTADRAPIMTSEFRYQGEGPYGVSLQNIQPRIYDPNNKLDQGRFGNRIESPITDEEADELRRQALNLEPSDAVQRIVPRGPAQLAPVEIVGFESIDFNDCCGGGGNVPPDPEIAVGPNHIIAVVNVAFAIYDKTGTELVAPTTFSSFFNGTPGCSNTGVFDPNVLYDESEDRFILGIDGNFTDYCVAATTGPDPTLTWNRYGFATNILGAEFDFPHVGVGRDAIYMGSNQFLGGFLEGRVFAMDKAAMYSGAPLTVVTHSTGASGGTPQPMNLHGFQQGTWPTSGPHYIMTEVFDGATHTVWSWDDPFGADTLTLEGNLDLNSATGTVAGFPIDVPQAGSGALLQANDWRGLDTEYRNGSIWMSNTISCNPGAGTVDCVRWAQIDPAVPSVLQAGVFGSDGDYRFFPDLAVNHCDDMGIGYTKSSTSMFPSVWVTGRESTDPAGVLQAEVELKAGEGDYTAFDGSPHRWGDYTGMTVDPDGETFWYLGEYSKNTGTAVGEWGTFIGGFRFAACGSGNSPPTVTISAPADGSTVIDGTIIDFEGTASDTEDGDLTAGLAWSSSLDGAIGAGGIFSTSLSIGTHTVTASVTDSGALNGADSITVTVDPPGGTTEVTFTSIGSQDGIVVETSETSGVGGPTNTNASTANALRVGDRSNDRQVVAFVSFDTSSIPDGATISSAELRVRRGGLAGTNPFTTHGAGVVDVSTGGFGGDPSLVASDFQAAADAPAAGTLSDAPSNLDWSESSLGAAGRAAIDTTGTTQMRLRFSLDDNDDGGTDFIGYYSGDHSNAGNHPQLIVAYSTGGNVAPTVTITGPADGSTFTDGDSIDFSGTASDPEDGDLTAGLDWTSSLDGSIGSGAAFSTTLSVGTHTITASVSDSGALPGSDAITVTVDAVANTPPTVTITMPADGSTFSDGDSIDFSGTASDPEDGDLSAGLDWSSSLDGSIGSGAAFSTTLSVGTHTITTSVSDSGALPGSDSITVTVDPIGGTVEVTLTSIASEDGVIFESSENSGVGGGSNSSSGNGTALRVGDLATDRQVVSIVSFDTSVLPAGATVVSANLRLRRGGLVGNDPFPTHGFFFADLSSGGFGGNTSLEGSDFQAAADVLEAGILSAAAANLDWSEALLTPAGLAAINVTGTTQLRVYFSLDDNDDGGNDLLGYYSGDNSDAANHPQLVIEYLP